MNWLTFKIKKSPGFRFNLIDLILLTVLALLSLLIYWIYPFYHLYLLPLYVGLTFFLFCNVFRIGNRLEAWWYLTFIAAAGYGLTNLERFWLTVLLVGEPIKIALILYRIIHGPYWGIFSKKPARAASN